MNLSDFDLKEACQIHAVANTPRFLVRKLKEEPVVRRISQECSLEEILEGLGGVVANDPTDSSQAVLPYVLLVALWFKHEKIGLERAAALTAPSFSWYAFIAAELAATFSPIQTQTIEVPLGASSRSVLTQSIGPTIGLIIKG